MDILDQPKAVCLYDIYEHRVRKQRSISSRNAKIYNEQLQIPDTPGFSLPSFRF